MEEDIRTSGWPARAACRWTVYSALWAVTVVLGLLSAHHVAMRIAAGFLGLLLAMSLPMLFVTLFEHMYARRARKDMVLACAPCLGAVVVIFGVVGLLSASSFVIAELSSVTVVSAAELSANYAGMRREELPRTICMREAFVKTDWEAGKLECEERVGHVRCQHAFTAAPIFDSKVRADAGKADEIRGWAVSRGRHVDANYHGDGTFCGYLAGNDDLEFYLGNYRLAVGRAIQKYGLELEDRIASSQIPLDARPLVMSVDPLEATYAQRAWLVLALIFLCLCPCVGPVPLGALFGFFCWSGRDPMLGRSLVPADEDDFEGALFE